MNKKVSFKKPNWIFYIYLPFALMEVLVTLIRSSGEGEIFSWISGIASIFICAPWIWISFLFDRLIDIDKHWNTLVYVSVLINIIILYLLSCLSIANNSKNDQLDKSA